MATSNKIKYPKPPIQEAICEIHFDANQKLQKNQIELLKPVWNSSYPNQRLIQEKSVTVNFTPEGVTPTENVIGERLVCKSSDGKQLAQLSTNFLAVNQVSPYLGWEESFRDMITQRWNDVQKNIGSLKFQRVGLRYINKIDIPQAPVAWERWLKYAMPVPKPISISQSRFEGKLEDPEYKFNINLLALPAVGAISPLIIDLDIIWERSGKDRNVDEVLEGVHTPLGSIFEAYLTDETRRLFGWEG